ncbi:radical SAM/SPASM domain-containing protein [Streptantibioticus rubrisoli]|uniref:Radical SAM protein n=1 Tax=Streptantibioticus rubrisoli TaxID=1387313 RepID=A0ABT1PAR0_9ACTN|nr:radical SAM protein [Streptantibioticus rubrisoli]MCQ4042445.1 radical SAM protein [Streptantibioticus rubrisoli]
MTGTTAIDLRTGKSLVSDELFDSTARPVTFLELEITGNCQLTCPSHCYAQAGPTQGHGTMTDEDWKKVIHDAATFGVNHVQFIGGEPTRRPGWEHLLRFALDLGLTVQLYSNLYRIKEEWWELLTHPKVTLATSYYSDQAEEHDRVTGRTGSHAKTRANITEAVRRHIPIKVGIVDILDGQRIDAARADLESLGVTEIQTDRVRGVGNATKVLPSVSELCGNCANGRAAVMPDGTVTPCVLGRFLPAGSVKTESLAGVLSGSQWAKVAASIPRRTPACAPDSCTPKEDSCQPSPGMTGACTPADSNDCDPSRTPACNPKYDS